MNAQIYWVGLSVVPAARNPQAQAELICGPYCHRDQAQSQADAMTSHDLAFEVFVQNISVAFSALSGRLTPCHSTSP